MPATIRMSFSLSPKVIPGPGNVTVYQLRGKLRCERCKDVIEDVELFHPTAQEAMTIRYRRLVEIKWVKRVVWRDEPGAS